MSTSSSTASAKVCPVATPSTALPQPHGWEGPPRCVAESPEQGPLRGRSGALRCSLLARPRAGGAQHWTPLLDGQTLADTALGRFRPVPHGGRLHGFLLRRPAPPFRPVLPGLRRLASPKAPAPARPAVPDAITSPDADSPWRRARVCCPAAAGELGPPAPCATSRRMSSRARSRRLRCLHATRAPRGRRVAADPDPDLDLAAALDPGPPPGGRGVCDWSTPAGGREQVPSPLSSALARA